MTEEVHAMRVLQTKVLQTKREAEVLEAELALAMNRYLRDNEAPSGYGLDLWGTGDLKPLEQCKMHPEPKGSDV